MSMGESLTRRARQVSEEASRSPQHLKFRKLRPDLFPNGGPFQPSKSPPK
jgi:hypothetical protein